MCEQQTLNSYGSKQVDGPFQIMKTLAMLGLPFVHVMENYSFWGRYDGELGGTEELLFNLTFLGPSIFMICMGLGLAYNTSAKRIRKTGIQMVIIAIAFNLVRFIIPGMLMCVDGLMSWRYIMNAIVGSDIYNFVGLFYILYSFIKEGKLNTGKIILLAVGFMAINIIASDNLYSETSAITSIGGNFITLSGDSYFPLLGWFIFPCIGIWIAESIFPLEIRKRNIAFAGILVAGIAITGIGILIAELKGESVWTALLDFSERYMFGIEQAMLITGITFAVIAAAHFIYQAVKENPVERFLISYSRLLLPFYVIHWLLTALATNYVFAVDYVFIGSRFSCGIAGVIIIAAVIDIASFIITYKYGFSFSRWMLKASDYTRWGKKRKKRRQA